MTAHSWPRRTEVATEKRCPHCGQVKPAEDFGLRNQSGVLLKSWCKTCMDETRRKYVEEHGSEYGRWVDWRDMPHGRLVHDGEQRTMAYRRAHWREQVAALEQA